ncbi:hypothetical protein TWF481_002410 [Arthrobotrys musiformis]|uniref:Uncharacterized protein n=1 Tax=Arthrobotrys musiformis TaxID=47236 RepID=A0AAV9VZ75_9PEZI
MSMCSSIVLGVTLPYLKAPVQLPPPNTRFIRGYQHRFVRLFRELLDHQLVKIDSLAIYKDPLASQGLSSTHVWFTGTEVLLGALVRGDTEIISFLCSNCVAFNDPRTLMEVIFSRGVPAVKLWIEKKASVNAQWMDSDAYIWNSQSVFWPWPGKQPPIMYRRRRCHHPLADTVFEFGKHYPFEVGCAGDNINRIDRSIKIICLLLKAPYADLNLRGVHTTWQITRPCFKQCNDPKCSDGRPFSDDIDILCQNCQSAPRSQPSFQCGEKDCFCLGYPLPRPLFDRLFWGLVQIQDPELKFFKWILKERLPFSNLEDILLQSIDTTILPHGYSNFQLFQALVDAYPYLQNALCCDRLLAEAIYYRQDDIVSMIRNQRDQRNKSVYVHNVSPPQCSPLDMPASNRQDETEQTQTDYIQSLLRNASIETLSHDERVEYIEKALSLGFGCDDWSKDLFVISSNRSTFDPSIWYIYDNAASMYATRSLFSDWAQQHKQATIAIYPDLSKGIIDHEWSDADHKTNRKWHIFRLSYLKSIIKFLLKNNYLEAFKSLLALFTRKDTSMYSGVWFGVVVSQAIEGFSDWGPAIHTPTRKSSDAKISFWGKQSTTYRKEKYLHSLWRIDFLIASFELLKHHTPDKVSRRPILILMKVTISILIGCKPGPEQDGPSPQLHKNTLALLRNLGAIYLDIDPEFASLEHLFSSIPELHVMVIASVWHTIICSVQPCQILENLKPLIEVGFDINAKDMHGCSLLMEVCINQYDPSGIYSRERKKKLFSDMPVPYRFESRRFHIDFTVWDSVQRFNYLVYIKGLIELGAKVDLAFVPQVGGIGTFTILYFWVEEGNYEVVELLLMSGAVKLLEYSTMWYYDWGIGNGTRHVPMTNPSRPKPIDEDCRTLSPLQRAAYDGNQKMVLLLLRYGADVDNCLKHGFTALYRAAQMGRLDVVDSLLKAGAKKKREQAAEIAEENGFHEIAKKIRTFPIKEDKIQEKIKQDYMQVTDLIGDSVGRTDTQGDCVGRIETNGEEAGGSRIEYISEEPFGILPG